MSFGQQGVEQGLEVPGYALGCLEGMGLLEGEAVAGVEDGGEGRADSKFQHGFGSGWRIAIASSVVMSCITACMPARID